VGDIREIELYESHRALSSLATIGESPTDTARRIRLELAALRSALREAHEQRDLAAVAASKARDGEEDARRELAALEWLTLNGYPCGRGPDGRVSASFREEDAEPDWCANWTEAARKLGKA
jgi:hypothetical protein